MTKPVSVVCGIGPKNGASASVRTSMHGETARREDPHLTSRFIEKVKTFNRLPASRTMQAVFAR